MHMNPITSFNSYYCILKVISIQQITLNHQIKIHHHTLVRLMLDTEMLLLGGNHLFNLSPISSNFSQAFHIRAI